MSNINNESSEKNEKELAQQRLENELPNFCSTTQNMAKTLKGLREKFISKGASKDYLKCFK